MYCAASRISASRTKVRLQLNSKAYSTRRLAILWTARTCDFKQTFRTGTLKRFGLIYTMPNLPRTVNRKQLNQKILYFFGSNIIKILE